MKKRSQRITRLPRRQPDLSVRYHQRYRTERKELYLEALDKLDPHTKNYTNGFRKGYYEGFDDGYNRGYYAGFKDAEYNAESVKRGDPHDLKWREKKDLSWYWL
jgi:hypothetical protein